MQVMKKPCPSVSRVVDEKVELAVGKLFDLRLGLGYTLVAAYIELNRLYEFMVHQVGHGSEIPRGSNHVKALDETKQTQSTGSEMQYSLSSMLDVQEVQADLATGTPEPGHVLSSQLCTQ